jgi:hypothetical protein
MRYSPLHASVERTAAGMASRRAFRPDGAALDCSPMLEAKKGFRRSKGYKQLPTLRDALIARYEQTNPRNLDKQFKVA